jgi:release factor glutamine methyltransferase
MSISLLTSNTIAAALKTGSLRLAAISASASLDAQVLMAHILGAQRSWLLAHPDAELSPEQAEAWDRALGRLEGGEALPYLLGEWEFYGLKMRITPDVLIPRPETELLVDTALSWLSANPQRRRAVDLGTGSGCIAVALAMHCPDLELWASDISVAALGVAASNLERYGLEARVTLLQSDLFDGLEAPFDLICANLPYIPSGRLPGLQVAAREPRLALDGGPDGLDTYRLLIPQAAKRARSGVLVEVGHDQAQRVTALFRRAGLTDLRTWEDLGGIPRVVGGRVG